MNRLLLLTVTAIAATGLAAAPAVAGLAGNPSFSHNIPVRVPSDARSVDKVNDHLTVRTSSGTPGHHSAVPSTSPSTHSPEPGDDNGGGKNGSTEPGDDNGGSVSRSPEPGDDNGGSVSRSPEPGDDNGGSVSRSPEPGDDNGGSVSRGPEPGDDHGSHGAGHH